MPPIGVGVGLYLSMAAYNREVEAQLAQHPGEDVCGNPAIPFLFLGLIGGVLAGVVAGLALARLVTWLARRCGYQDAYKGAALDHDTLADELIATESKREDLLSEIDLVERLIVQAESGGDEEVRRKLLDYRAKLEQQFEV
jgi:hypothetical protein